MTYRGVLTNGVVVLEGQSPLEGTIVEVTPIERASTESHPSAQHPAIGMWKDRTDLPQDPVAASKALRQRLLWRADE